jgi:DNA repair protein RecO (recombination protein O)
LPSLIAAETQGKALMLKADALACGMYMNELIMRLTHRAEPQIELFSAYDASLRQLTSTPAESEGLHLQQVLRQFEIRLLHCLGYGLVLNEEAGSGKKIRSDLVYDFQLETGAVVVDNPHQEVFGIKISGKTLLGLANNQLQAHNKDAAVYREAKQLLRFVLDRYLGNKPLLSRQLLHRKTAAPQARD